MLSALARKTETDMTTTEVLKEAVLKLPTFKGTFTLGERLGEKARRENLPWGGVARLAWSDIKRPGTLDRFERVQKRNKIVQAIAAQGKGK